MAGINDKFNNKNINQSFHFIFSKTKFILAY